MSFELSLHELRVIGALIEKQLTTPDQYPLTLKALQSACNQKSNRDPVLNIDERTLQVLVAVLEKKYLLSCRTEYGSRVTKHRQRFCNTEFGNLQFTPAEQAIICCLMLRGAQTPGELRSRTGRLHQFADVHEVEEALNSLMTRDDGPFVTRLEREPGRRDSRYMHLLGDEEVSASVTPAAVQTTNTPSAQPVSAADPDRIELLEIDVEELKAAVAALRAELAEIKGES